jgi:hypothetical protein
VQIPAGGTAKLEIGVPAAVLDRVQLDLSDPPEGISIKNVSSSSQGTEVVLQSDAAKVKPGLKGNLIVAAFAKTAPSKGKPKPKAAGRRSAPLTTLPAVPFEIVVP